MYIYVSVIQGNRAAARNLNSKVNKVDQESLKQQELIYSQVSDVEAVFLMSSYISVFLS